MIINKNGLFHYDRKDNRRTMVDVRKGIKVVIPEKVKTLMARLKKPLLDLATAGPTTAYFF